MKKMKKKNSHGKKQQKTGKNVSSRAVGHFCPTSFSPKLIKKKKKKKCMFFKTLI
jgi:hypothetical protein